jgi:hypothetical protein
MAGPFGEVNYKLRMTNRRKQKWIFRINMLQAWHAPTALSCWAESTTDNATNNGDNETGQITYFDPDTDSEPVFGDSTNHRHPFALGHVFYRCTNIMQHHIKTGEAKPVRLPCIRSRTPTTTHCRRN